MRIEPVSGRVLSGPLEPVYVYEVPVRVWHWVKIKNTRIDSYQCVVPTTWNAGPRDAKGQIGAYEAALLNTPMAKPDQPLEILRTLHSFDPCLACATHVISPAGEELTRVTVR